VGTRRVAGGWIKFVGVRFLDSYRVERSSVTDRLANVRFLDGYRVELIERGA
jgi:hypothetical protein